MRTDCPKCQELTQILEQAKSKYQDKIQVLSVVTMPDNLPLVKAYIAKYKVTSPILFDCGQVIASYVKPSPESRGSVDLPAVFVVDKSGMIRTEMHHDQVTPPAVLGAIEAALR